MLCGRDAVGDAPFAVLLPDDIIDADPPALGRMLDVFAACGGPVLLVERVPHDAVDRYGIIAAEPVGDGVFRVTDLVEKPPVAEAPSDLAIIGRYVLTPDVFDILEATERGAGGEIQLTDGLRRLLKTRPIYACALHGTRLDAGNRGGYLKATIHFAAKQPALAADLREAAGQRERAGGQRLRDATRKPALQESSLPCRSLARRQQLAAQECAPAKLPTRPEGRAFAPTKLPTHPQVAPRPHGRASANQVNLKARRVAPPVST